MSEFGEFGTLGCSSDDPTEFFGSNEEAYIDEDGMLHGLPPFEALDFGVVICPSPLHEECFYVYSPLRWDEFICAVKADLCEESGKGSDCPDESVRTRVTRLLDELSCRVSADDGLVPVPEAVSGTCGMEANERLRVIGSSGYFEVWRKPACDEALSSIDVLGVLLGDGK